MKPLSVLNFLEALNILTACKGKGMEKQAGRLHRQQIKVRDKAFQADRFLSDTKSAQKQFANQVSLAIGLLSGGRKACDTNDLE